MGICVKGKGNGHRAFSTLEMLIAIAIGIFIAVMLIGTLVPGFRTMTDITRKERVYASAKTIGDTLSYHVRQGAQLTSVGPNDLTIIHADGTTVNFVLASGVLKMNGAAISSSDVTVNQTNFVVLARSVRYGLKLTGKGGTVFFATSTVALRN